MIGDTAPGIDAQPHGSDPDEPWMAFLLGCASLARRAGTRTGPARRRMPGVGMSGPPGASGIGPRRDAALDVLLGVAALAGRFDALLGEALGDATPEDRAPRREPPGELLR
jgi:hypothetical protein